MAAVSTTERRVQGQLLFAWAAAALLSIAGVWRFTTRRPPYFARPATVLDHVDVRPHAGREVLLLLPQVEPLLPRGAEVTCFRPKDGKAWDDNVNYLTAVGLLRHQAVFPPFSASPGRADIEYVIAVGEPFEHPSYEPVAGFTNGFLYRRK